VRIGSVAFRANDEKMDLVFLWTDYGRRNLS